MSTPTKPLQVDSLVGGQNSADPPLSLPDRQCVSAVNVDWNHATLAHKRTGAANVDISQSNFTGIVSSLIRHVPGADERVAQLWGVDAAAHISRLTTSDWVPTTPSEAPAGSYHEVNGASHNGKLFLCYDSSVDRVHVWDGTSLRKAGIGTPAAPTADNTGSGSYAATIRYYRVAFTVQAAGVTLRRSELSAALSFTPSGSGTAARVTKPASLSEGETHWELFGSPDGNSYYLLATTAVATTTYDDSTAPASYSGDQPELTGTNTVIPSAKYVVSDGNRLLFGGSWESGQKACRVWYTPVLGDSDVGDDERTPTTTAQNYWVDISEKDGGVLTGLAGPMEGSVYAFKTRQVWKLVPTGLSTAPYRALCETKVVGSVNQKGIVVAEDQSGNPALYFWSHLGPYRLGYNGLEYLGRDIEDVVATVNLEATSVPVHGVYHHKLHQVWWWVATGSSNDPDTKLVLDVRRTTPSGEGTHGGWAVHNGNSAAARCSALFSTSAGAAMSRTLAPWIGRATGAAVWRCDTGTDDAGTAYQAYVETKPYAGNWLVNLALGEPHVVAAASTGAVLEVRVIKDFGRETRYGQVVLTATGAETRVVRKVDGVSCGQCAAVAFRVGDQSANTAAWTVDALIVPVTGQEPR